jgi:1-acyl-sn-glycerol-3-phosphate acyltransferase
MLRAGNRAWRLIGTGFAFAFIFAGGALAAVTLFPLIACMTRPGAVRHRTTRLAIRHIFRFYVGMLQVLGLIRLKVDGAKTLADTKGCLVVANHPTILDVVLLVSMLPHVQCIVKGELWKSRYLGGVMRAAGYIRNDADAGELLTACTAAISDGVNVLIFPEGTRTKPNTPLHLQRGFANIALLSGARIQLVTITCKPITLTKGEPWWRIPTRRPDFSVSAGECLETAEMLNGKIRSLAARHLVKRLESYYTERLSHA